MTSFKKGQNCENGLGYEGVIKSNEIRRIEAGSLPEINSRRTMHENKKSLEITLVFQGVGPG